MRYKSRRHPPPAHAASRSAWRRSEWLRLGALLSIAVILVVAGASAVLLHERRTVAGRAVSGWLRDEYASLTYRLSPREPDTARRSAPSPQVAAPGSATRVFCSPTAGNPVFFGCFAGNSPYRHTVASLLNAGARVHADSSATNFWNNGNPLTANNINVDGHGATKMWIASSGDPAYDVTCPAYKPGYCAAATSQTGMKVHIPSNAAPTTDSDHHIFVFDTQGRQELDMWGGFAPSQACQVGTNVPGTLTCSWGGAFPFSGNGLPIVPGASGIAGGVAYGMAAITAGDILSGHIRHAVGLIGPCLDDDGHFPSTPGRGSDSKCRGNAANGGDGAEPTLHYGDMIHLKASVNLDAPPYSTYTKYCQVVVKALQEYGAYADDNSNGYGLHVIVVNQTDPGWRTIMESMIAGGDASGSPVSASWNSCLNRIAASDLEAITLNQGDRTIAGASAMLPSMASP